MIKHLEKLNKKFINCKIFVDDIQKIIEEIKNVINFLGIYDVIFIPFIGQSNAGKSTLINSIIGKNILPIGLNECTKRGYIIKYLDEDEDIISRAYIKKEIIQGRDYFYFEEKKNIGMGEKQVRQTLNGLNSNFNIKEEDAFYFIRTKIKLFDDLNFNDYYKKMIYLIDFPGFGTGENNFFDKNEIYKKAMNICNSFIFVIRNSKIKENENQRILNEIFDSVKEQKSQFSSKFIKSCLFILNNDNSQPTEGKDLENAKNEIKQLILGIKTEDIKVCFFNAENYSNFNKNYNYFNNLEDTFKIEYNNFIEYNERLFTNPGKNKKYNSFYEYFYKVIMDKIKSEKICDDKGIPKNQKINESYLNNIKEIVKKEPFNKDKYFNKYQKYIAQLISFGKENINNLETLKKSNIEEFKKIFLAQTININNGIQKRIKKEIEEIISTLDLFFIENKEGDSKGINKFNNKINENINNLNLLLKNSKDEIKNLKTELEKKIKESLEKKSIILNDLLKFKNCKEILKEINGEIKNNISELKDKFSNFIKNIDMKSKELIDNAKDIFKKFYIKNTELKFKNFENFFLENIGDKNKNLIDEMYEEMINSTESLGKIFLRKGFVDWLYSLFSNYDYLWNIVDLLTQTYLGKINKIINLLYNQFDIYINSIIRYLKRIITISIRNFNKEQLLIFQDLKTFYETEKNEIIKIKLNLCDNI